MGAPLLVACGAPTADEDGSGGEAIGSVAQAATDPALDAKFVGTSVAGGWRFRGDVAEYAMCPNVPIGVRYDFKNVGKVVLQDVEGQGDKKGSDVKLVTTSGNADPITKKTHFSVRDNDNAFVSPDPDAPDCYDEKGCKKTRFKKFAFAPAEAGVHTSKWRLRDYSSVWDGKSQGFGPKIAVRYKVTPGGCTYRCKTGVTKDVVASAETCAAVAASMCDGSEKVQTAMYLSCDAPGLVGPGGTGGTGGTGGSGGSGGTGGGGSGGGGTGGGGAGTAGAGGSAGGSACDCELLPGLEAGEPCCLPDGQCGVTADFLQWQCYPLPDDSDFDENELTPPDDGSHLGEEDFEDDPGFHDPPGLEEQGGVTLADGGGCSASARRPGASWLWSGFAVAALAIRRQRRRLASRLTLRGTRPARYNT